MKTTEEMSHKTPFNSEFAEYYYGESDLEREMIRTYLMRIEEIIVKAVKKEFPILMRRYPSLGWPEKFIIRHIIHLRREVYTFKTDSFDFSQDFKISYRLPFGKKKYIEIN